MRTWPALDLSCPVTPAADDVPGHLAAFLDDHAPTAIVDTSTSAVLRWRVFFGSAEARDAAARALAAHRADVGAVPVDVPDEQWAERSQAGLRAIRIGRVVVTPPWDLDAAPRARDASADPGDSPDYPVLVIIEPSTGFGTGHHESTRLCLRALQRLDLTGKTVVDLGTGSGVLAIAAARLGCGRALAIDDDADAVEAARLNLRRNGVGDRVEVHVEGIGASAAAQGDVVVGNLTGALLRRLAADVTAYLAPGATLILSGFTEDERGAVAHAFAPLTVARAETEQGWVALTLTAGR